MSLDLGPLTRYTMAMRVFGTAVSKMVLLPLLVGLLSCAGGDEVGPPFWWAVVGGFAGALLAWFVIGVLALLIGGRPDAR